MKKKRHQDSKSRIKIYVCDAWGKHNNPNIRGKYTASRLTQNQKELESFKDWFNTICTNVKFSEHILLW